MEKKKEQVIFGVKIILNMKVTVAEQDYYQLNNLKQFDTYKI